MLSLLLDIPAAACLAKDGYESTKIVISVPEGVVSTAKVVISAAQAVISAAEAIVLAAKTVVSVA